MKVIRLRRFTPNMMPILLLPRLPGKQQMGCTPAALGLEQRFATTYSLLCIHVWLALVRLRAESKDGKHLAQMLYENFQDDVEVRVRAEGVKVRYRHGCMLCHISISLHAVALQY